MMARNKSWSPVGIHLVCIAALCLSSNHHQVDASNENVPPPVPQGPPGCGSYCTWMPKIDATTTPGITDHDLEKLAKDILTEMFQAKHKSQIETMLNKGDTDLDDNELGLKRYFDTNDKENLRKARKKLKEPTGDKTLTENEAIALSRVDDTGKLKELSNGEMRQRLIHTMETTEKGYQTIAVGIDPETKTVVVAGNIKELAYDDLQFNHKKKESKMNPQLKSEGIQESDYAAIKKMVQEMGKFPDYKIVVISLSEADKQRAYQMEVERVNKYLKKEDTPRTVDNLSDHEKINAAAHFFHAEMQIKEYFKNKLAGKRIMASKPFCINCGNNIKRLANRLIRFVTGYVNPDMRWVMPSDVHSIDITNIGVPDQAVPRRLSLQDEPEGINSKPDPDVMSCNRGGGRRRRRSSCSRFQDVTEVDADKFQRKYEDLPDGDKEKLLSALDQVGTDKLKGSEPVKKDIKSKWKKWKSSVVKGVMGALSQGAIISHLFGPKSLELSKTAISPKLLAESVDIMHQQNIKSAAEDNKGKGGKSGGDKSEGFGTSYKVVKYVNMAMLGKNLIGGMMNGDTESLITMGTLLGSDQLLTKVGEKLTAKGIKLAEAGQKTVGGVLKAAGPILGTATSAFSIYSLVGHVNQIASLKQICKDKDNLFQERLHKDCKFDMDVAIANTVTDVVGIVSTVATVGVAIAKIFAYATGPVGIVAAVIDVAVSIGLQIYAAVQQVAKVSSSLVGGLTGSERFVTGFRAFIGMNPPRHIQDLLDTKESYNAIVTQAVAVLKSAENYQTYVLPTNHTRSQKQVNCRNERQPTNAGRVLTGIFSLGFSELYYTRPVEKCDTVQEFEEDNAADFQNWQQLNKFRVEPDRPSWGVLECKPNSIHGRYYRNDPEHVGSTHGFLCYNVIAMSAPNRSHLPVLVDLKDGTDSFLGFRNRRHVFQVGAGFKNFTGGSADDVFVINSFPFRGHLDGAGGMNTLILDKDVQMLRHWHAPQDVQLVANALGEYSLVYGLDQRISAVYDFAVKRGVLLGADARIPLKKLDALDLRTYELLRDLEALKIPKHDVGKLLVSIGGLVVQYLGQPRVKIDFSSCEQCSSYENSLKNFQQIIGRSQKPDSLLINCTVTYVDLNGGQSESKLDEITIPPSKCNTSLTFQLRPFTKVNNDHEANGEFTYQMELAHSIQVNLDPEKNVHRFIFTSDVLTAHLSYQSGYLLVTNENPNKAFKCNYIKSTTSKLLLMSQQGLLISYDQDSDSFYGLVPPSDGEIVQEVMGLVNYPNRFIISTNGALNLTGGSKDDIFSLTGPIRPLGSIDGRGGFDTVIMQQDFEPGAAIAIDLPSNVLSPGDLRISNIESIIGRHSLSEVLQGSCELHYVDLKGGNMNDSDLIQFSSQLSCKSEMTLMVRRFTSVENLASGGNFSYQIELGISAPQTNFIHVDLEGGSAMHKYTFLRPSSSVREVKFDQVSKKLEICFENESWTGTIPIERSAIYMEDELLLQLVPEVQGIVRVESNTSASVISGLRTYPNTFVLGMTTRDSSFTGGREDDNFLVMSENVYGKLDGGEGTNTLFLTDTASNEKFVIINVVNNSLAVASGNETDYQFEFKNIQRFFGREGQADIILPECNTQLIDSKGGGNDYDLVHISSLPDCYFSLDVAIRPNLIVVNDATEGEFKYEGDFRNGGGSTSIFLTFTPYTSHKVYLDMDSHEYNDLTLTDGRVNITASDGSQFSVDFFIPEGADSHTEPSISFRDGLELKIFGNGLMTATLFGTLRNFSPGGRLEENIERESDLIERNRRAAKEIDWSDLIRSYKRAAKDALTSVIMKIDSNTLVSIGSGGNLDILTAVPGYLKNMLVCNSAKETIYRIANGSSNVQIIFDLESSGPKLLDLTPIVKDDFEIFPTLQAVRGQDLKFQIKDVEITIIGLASASYEFLTSWQVVLRERFLNIEEDDAGSFKLVTQPIVIDPKTVDSFVVHMPSLEPGMKILTASTNDSYPIKYEAVKQGDNLVFTNLFQQDSSDDVASSVVFYDFYKEKAPEALHEKRVMFEVEAGVMVNVTQETGAKLPTFEQREHEAFGPINPLFFIVPIFGTFLIGIAWLCWYQKWYKSLKVFKGNYQLVPTARRVKMEDTLIAGTRWRSGAHGKPADYELIPISKPAEPSMDMYKILSDVPAIFKIIEKPLPVFQGLLRLQNFSSYDRYCRSSIECLEGVVPLPHVLVRALFSPHADCIKAEENGLDFVVALPTESVSNVANVLFTLCLRKRSAVIRTDQGEIIHGIRRIMQVLRPACAQFIEQQMNPPTVVVAGDGIYFSSRFVRFVLCTMDGKEHQAVVNTEGQFRLLEEPESALLSLDELGMRIQIILLPQERFATFPMSFFRSISMMSGELNFDEVFGPQRILPFPFAAQALYFVFTVAMTIVLISLFTALTVDDVGQVLKESEIMHRSVNVERLFILRRMLHKL